ncbi:MAG: fatty acyl-AMP ligase [Candidatus Tectomicrobia bacterium]|nr:fatty acyl-AMP ligase [Candidatus Tectomicrobia bacterium]
MPAAETHISSLPGALSRVNTLVDALRERAQAHPQRPLYTFLRRARDVERNLTFGTLDARARAIAASIRAHALPGDCAVIICPNDLSFIEAFMGCQYAGVIPVPSPSLQGYHAAERLRRVLGAVSTACVITTSAIEDRLKARADALPELAAIAHLCVDTVPAHDWVQWSAPDIDAHDVAFVQFTSGSLSAPKGVKVSHANILHNLEMLHSAFGHTDESRIVSWLPFFHDWGLIGGLLQPIYSGIQSVLFDPLEFVRKPRNWLETISRFGATVSGAPNFAYDRCLQTIEPEDVDGLDLNQWEVAIVGAERICADTLDRFEFRFAPCGFKRTAFFTSYGLAESTLVVTGGRRDEAPVTIAIDREALEGGRVEPVSDAGLQSCVRLVSNGHALLDQDVRIVDPERCAPCDDMQIGEIWVAGRSVVQGYWELDAATAEQFAATLLGDTDRSYLRTGDQGFLSEGELYITGRIKDLIIVSGRNLYPEDIERVADEADPTLRQGKGAAFSIDVNGVEHYIVAHEVQFAGREDGDMIIESIRSAVTRVIGVAPWAIALIKAGGIPTTSSGKIQRQATKQRFLADELPCLRVWRQAPQG